MRRTRREVDTDFDYAFYARLQEEPGFVGPLYGYEQGAIDPVVGYPFVEWEDVPLWVQFLVSVPEDSHPDDFGVRNWNDLAVVLSDAPGPITVRNVLAHQRAEEQKKRDQLSEAMRAAQEERQVADGMDKYLKADPGEIKAIMQAMEAGSLGREVSCSEPIPVFTCCSYDGSSIRGVLPGSMSNCVTAAQPEKISQSSPSGRMLVTYRQRVFLK